MINYVAFITIAIEAAVTQWKAQGKLPDVRPEEDLYASAGIGQDVEFDSDEGGMEVEWEEGREESNVTESSQQDVEDSEIIRKKQVYEKELFIVTDLILFFRNYWRNIPVKHWYNRLKSKHC